MSAAPSSPFSSAVAGDGTAVRWRAGILAATNRAAERLVDSQLEPAAFSDALRLFGAAAGVDRTFIFQFHPGQPPGGTLCSHLYEWCRPDLTPWSEEPDFQTFGFADHARLEPLLDSDRELPSATSFLLPQAVRPAILLPLATRGFLWGFLGCEDIAHASLWASDPGALRPLTRLFGAAFDRSERHQQKHRLLEEYRQLLDTIREVVFRIGAHGHITFLSPAWREFSGRDPATCIGCSMSDFLHPDCRALWQANASGLVHGSKTLCQSELLFLHADGSPRWALGRARRLGDENQRALGFAGTLVDITGMKSTENALIEARAAAESANRSKSEFLSTMSHELRTPLNAVLGLSESLIESGSGLDPVRTRRYLELIHQGGHQLLEQINEILDLARLESGRSLPMIAPLAVDELCAQAAARVQPAARAGRLDLRLPAATGIHLPGDRRMLLQALHNLLDNAIKFTPAGGTIELFVQPRPTTLALGVRDTGVGIATDRHDRLFKPFSQIDSSLSRRFGGTGLGLALVDRIVILHHGRVTFESAPGQGSTFVLELPLETPAEPRCNDRPDDARPSPFLS